MMMETFIVKRNEFIGGYDVIKQGQDFFDSDNVTFEVIKNFKSKAKAERVVNLLNE